MAVSTCTVTGNVRDLLGNGVSDCIIKASVLSPFIYGTSLISGQIASVSTNSSGDWSLTLLETTSVGQRLTVTFDYFDGVSNRKLKAYQIVVPNQPSAAFTDLLSISTPPTTATYPAQGVTVSAITNLTATTAQAAFAEIQADVDTRALQSDLTAHTGNTSNPHSTTAAQIGLGNVTNTSDANKPVSTAQQTALDLKANLASPTFTGAVTAPTFVGALTGNASTATSATSATTATTATNFSGSLTGDVSGTQGATVIGANKVTNAQRAQMPANTIKGNNTGSTANEADLTVAQTQTLLSVPTASSPLALGSGGTGTAAASANAAFNALSPMTTSGDIIYGGASGAATRLAKGVDGRVLTLASGVPTWATSAAGATGSYYQGFTSAGARWDTTSTTFVDPTLGAGANTLTSRASNGLTVTAAASNLPGITWTPSSATAVYLVTATSGLYQDTSGQDSSVKLTDGTIIVSGAGMQAPGTADQVPVTLTGIYAPATASAVTLKLQLACSGGTARLRDVHGLVGSIQWTIVQLTS